MIDYSEIGRALHDLGFRLDPAEYHGALCGMLCVQPEPPDDLGLEADDPVSDSSARSSARELLAQLRESSLAHLADPDMDFTPLLPEDDEALTQRVDALAQWCQGFLYGLGTQPALDLNQASAEVREVVGDMIQISRAGVEVEDEEQSEEADESAYMELVEYVRAGVQLVFLELHSTESDRGSPSSALH